MFPRIEPCAVHFIGGHLLGMSKKLQKKYKIFALNKLIEKSIFELAEWIISSTVMKCLKL